MVPGFPVWINLEQDCGSIFFHLAGNQETIQCPGLKEMLQQVIVPLGIHVVDIGFQTISFSPLGSEVFSPSQILRALGRS